MKLTQLQDEQHAASTRNSRTHHEKHAIQPRNPTKLTQLQREQHAPPTRNSRTHHEQHTVRSFVCLFGGVSKASKIRTLPKTSVNHETHAVRPRKTHSSKTSIVRILAPKTYCVIDLHTPLFTMSPKNPTAVMEHSSSDPPSASYLSQVCQ
jgi:hypothetical protein